MLFVKALCERMENKDWKELKPPVGTDKSK